MSLKLYLDDCAYSRRLRRLLREAGHDVQIPAEVNPSLMGSDDTIHFAHARVTRRVILTFNPKDFKVLHDRHSEHPGILAVYHDNNPTKDMSYAEIVRAIANLERSVFDISGGFWVLNAYRW